MSVDTRGWALAGLHDTVWRLVQPRLNDLPSQDVIDIGCGPGAFIRRLRDHGCNCSACDIKNNLADDLGDVRYIHGDLDDANVADKLAAKGRYGLVIALEIIEHVENPWHLMRVLNMICELGGLCVVSTPNNQDEQSRIDFLMSGELPWFKVANILSTVHISPIFLQLFYVMLQHASFSLDGYYRHASVPIPPMNLKGRLLRCFMQRKLMRGAGLAGVNHVWVLRKSAELTEDGMVKNKVEYLKNAERWANEFTGNT